MRPFFMRLSQNMRPIATRPGQGWALFGFARKISAESEKPRGRDIFAAGRPSLAAGKKRSHGRQKNSNSNPLFLALLRACSFLLFGSIYFSLPSLVFFAFSFTLSLSPKHGLFRASFICWFAHSSSALSCDPNDFPLQIRPSFASAHSALFFTPRQRLRRPSRKPLVPAHGAERPGGLSQQFFLRA